MRSGFFLWYSSGCLALLLALPSSAEEKPTPNWPQFRGPAGTGIAAETEKAPVEFGPGKKMAWKTAVPAGHSSPSLWGDRIFLTAFDKTTQKLEVLSLDRKNGKILWRRTVPAEQLETVHEISNPATATAALDGERVYAYFGSYGLICFDFEGNLQWSVPLPVANVPWGSGTSPIVVGDMVILNRDEGKEPYLLAVERRTGKTIWKQPQYLSGGRAAMSKATPVLWKEEIIIHRAPEIVGFDLKTGSRKWWVKAFSQGTGTPVAGPDAIYVGTWFNTGEPDLRVPLPDFDSLLKNHDKNGDGQLSAEEFPESIPISRRIEVVGVKGADMSAQKKSFFNYRDKNKDGQIDRSEWDAAVEAWTKSTAEHGLLAIKPGGEGDVTSTHVLWKETRGVPEIPAPLYYKNRVYAVTNGGIVSTMDAQTGKLLFRGRLGAGGPYYASPVTVGEKIYFASGDGVISVIGSEGELKVLAKNDLQEPIFATPAIVHRTLYVRTTSHLYAFTE